MQTWRNVPADDLKNWRKSLGKGHQRGVSPALRTKQIHRPAHQVSDDTAAFETDDFKPATPREAKERLERQVLGWGKRDRESFRVLATQLRTAQPTLVAHLSDEQIAEKLEREWDERARAAIAKAYHAKGRQDELKIKTAGW